MGASAQAGVPIFMSGGVEGGMVPVTIICGPVRSGKTTRLARWAAGRVDVSGVLSPDGPDGRVFVDLATSETVAMENPRAGEPEIAAGRFRFRAAAFGWANERLLQAAASARETTLVIDEIGPLELEGGGLRPGLVAALARPRGRVILIVRAHLVDAVRSAFAIPQAEIASEIG